MPFSLLVPPMILDTSRSLVVMNNKTGSSSFPHFPFFLQPLESRRRLTRQVLDLLMTHQREYVKYLFRTTADIIDLVVLAQVASFWMKPYSMKLVGEGGELNPMEIFGLLASKCGLANLWSTNTGCAKCGVRRPHLALYTFIDGMSKLTAGLATDGIYEVNFRANVVPGFWAFHSKKARWTHILFSNWQGWPWCSLSSRIAIKINSDDKTDVKMMMIIALHQKPIRE
jgi:hypothetical protein